MDPSHSSFIACPATHTSCSAATRCAQAFFELFNRKPQSLSGVFLIAIALLKRFKQHDSLDLGEHYHEMFAIAHAGSQIDLGWNAVLRQIQVMADDHIALGEHHRTLNLVFQLAYVARPIIAFKHLDRLFRDFGWRRAWLETIFIEEVLDQDSNIAAALA